MRLSTDFLTRDQLADMLLRGDRAAVAAAVTPENRERLTAWKNAMLREWTEAYKAGELPFCQLTAIAQAAAALDGGDAAPVACCGAVAGNTSSAGLQHTLMLLRAWGVPTLNLGVDVSAGAFLEAVERQGVRYAVCVGFSSADAGFVRLLHDQAEEKGLRGRFRLLLCGAALSAEDMAALPVDDPDNRAAAVTEWMVDTWTA